MKPGNRALDNPARLAQLAAMRRTGFGGQGRNATLAQALPMWLGTVAPVALNNAWLVQWTSLFAAKARDRCDQRVELSDVMAMRTSQDDCERDALRVDDEVVLAAELAPVRWVRASFFPPVWCESKNCRRWRALDRVGRAGVALPVAFRG
jgi:hypothetical protein